jgi:hypothetical protein
MSTKRPPLTGFCNPSHPLGGYAGGYNPHERCRPTADAPCSCVCHQEPEPAPATTIPDPSSAPAAASREPGFYDDIAEADYHRDPASLSHSGAKAILRAPALFRHEQLHPVVKREYDFGSAAHRLVLGVGDPIVIVERTDTKTGEISEADDYKTPSSRAHADKIRAENGIPLLRKEYDVVQAMADELSCHQLAMELLSEGRPEVSAYAPDEETGIMRRCRFDWLGTTILVDYKSAESADPAAFGRKAADFGYHQQAPWYLDLARQLGHPAEAFAFIVQMKKPPYLVTVTELVPRAVERGRELNRRALQMYRDCLEADSWSGYVPDTEFASVDLPPWAYTDHEVELSA